MPQPRLPNPRSIVMLVSLALATPLAFAHTPEGTFRNYCEDPSEWDTHEYAAPATAHVISDVGRTAVEGFVGGNLGSPAPASQEASYALLLRGWVPSLGDGNIAGDCNGDAVPADYDGHQEWAIGGGWLSAENGDGATTGSIFCSGETAHHAYYGPVTVYDIILGSFVAFSVAADTVSLVPPLSGENCGDFESDESTSCFASCTVTFPPGLDGTYQVYVGEAEAGSIGNAGHIVWGSGTPPPQCGDGIDNDGDGLTDYPADPGCTAAGDPSEADPQCRDGVDNDGDGWTDYPDDPGCWDLNDPSEAPNPQCSDGIDNDGDGATDYPADNGCVSLRDYQEKTYACEDGVDNDGDGATDYPADGGCDWWSDDSESPNPACSNGADDDGDGLADYPNDPGCSSPRDTSESDGTPPPQCADGLDNDGDFFVDYPEDPGCASAADTSETDSHPRPACSDKADNDGDLKIDWPADPDCDSPVDDNEHPGPDSAACSDGLDNDGDGLRDYPADPQCRSLGDDDEAA